MNPDDIHAEVIQDWIGAYEVEYHLEDAAMTVAEWALIRQLMSVHILMTQGYFIPLRTRYDMGIPFRRDSSGR